MKFNNLITFYTFLTMTTGLSLRAALVEQVVTPEEVMYIKSKNKVKERTELVEKEICGSTPIPLGATSAIVVLYLASDFIKTTEFDLSETEIKQILEIDLTQLKPKSNHYITLDRPWLLKKSYNISLNPTAVYSAGTYATEYTTTSPQGRYKTINNLLMPFSITFADQRYNLVKNFPSKDAVQALFSNDENESYCCCIDFNGRATILSQIKPDIIFREDTTEQTSEQT